MCLVSSKDLEISQRSGFDACEQGRVGVAVDEIGTLIVVNQAGNKSS